MRLLARSVGQNHSRDSAIDTDLQVYTIAEIQLFQILIRFSFCQEWETETVVLEVGGEDELGVELAGGRDDPICPGENPIYVSSINKVE